MKTGMDFCHLMKFSLLVAEYFERCSLVLRNNKQNNPSLRKRRILVKLKLLKATTAMG